MDDIISASLKQLLTQSPMLLVCLAGLILALVFVPRCPAAGILVLIGTVVLLLSFVTWTFVLQYLIHSYNNWGWSADRLNVVLRAAGVAHSFLHAIGLALLLAAVFVGRRRPVTG